jgi:hypothetical protein
MSREAEDLATHVEICAVRYQGIQEKFDIVDARLDNIDRMLVEIKEMINRQSDRKFNAVVGSLATVLTAFLGLLGYVIMNIK